jgi:hypothetical protein
MEAYPITSFSNPDFLVRIVNTATGLRSTRDTRAATIACHLPPSAESAEDSLLLRQTWTKHLPDLNAGGDDAKSNDDHWVGSIVLSPDTGTAWDLSSQSYRPASSPKIQDGCFLHVRWTAKATRFLSPVGESPGRKKNTHTPRNHLRSGETDVFLPQRLPQ